MSQLPFDEYAKRLKVLPVLTVRTCEEAVSVSRALLAGGIEGVEITLRTPVAIEALAAVKQELPELVVAAGTVTNAKELQAVMDAGVDFGVSPASTAALFDAIDEIGLPFLPGVATPSEALSAMERGFHHLKLFPAQSVGGLSLLKSLSAPLSAAKFCPTGGLNEKNFTEFLQLPNVFCVGGSWMVSADTLEQKNWDAISLAAQQTMQLAAE